MRVRSWWSQSPANASGLKAQVTVVGHGLLRPGEPGGPKPSKSESSVTATAGAARWPAFEVRLHKLGPVVGADGDSHAPSKHCRCQLALTS